MGWWVGPGSAGKGVLHATLLLHATLFQLKRSSLGGLTTRRNCLWILSNIEMQQLPLCQEAVRELGLPAKWTSDNGYPIEPS